MNITITIPDADENRVVGKIAKLYGWNPSYPTTRRQFVKEILIGYLKSDLERAERQELIDAQPPTNDITFS